MTTDLDDLTKNLHLALCDDNKRCKRFVRGHAHYRFYRVSATQLFRDLTPIIGAESVFRIMPIILDDLYGCGIPK